MYCNPDFVLNTVTDLPPSVLEVNVGGDVDRGMLATPSISFAYAVEGFVNIVDVRYDSGCSYEAGLADSIPPIKL